MTYTTNTIENGTWRIDQAESLGDVLNHLSATKSPWDCELSSDQAKEGTRFNITNSFAEALAVAREGWPEGTRQMITGLDASRLVQPQARVKCESLDVAGAYPIVPAYISGDPDCMVAPGLDQSAGTQIIRLVVNISYVGAICAQSVLNRGIAILSWVDRLESEGARVEIIALRSTESHIPKVNRYSLTFPLKRADEPLDVDRAAFVLAHPDMLRRIGFATMERHGDMQKSFSQPSGGGYGRSSNHEPDQWKVPHSIYFNALRDEDENDKYKTIAKACETVEAIIKAGLTQEEAQAGES